MAQEEAVEVADCQIGYEDNFQQRKLVILFATDAELKSYQELIGEIDNTKQQLFQIDDEATRDRTITVDLSNSRVVALCKRTEGKTQKWGIRFVSGDHAMEWHKTSKLGNLFKQNRHVLWFRGSPITPDTPAAKRSQGGSDGDVSRDHDDGRHPDAPAKQDPRLQLETLVQPPIDEVSNTITATWRDQLIESPDQRPKADYYEQYTSPTTASPNIRKGDPIQDESTSSAPFHAHKPPISSNGLGRIGFMNNLRKSSSAHFDHEGLSRTLRAIDHPADAEPQLHSTALGLPKQATNAATASSSANKDSSHGNQGKRDRKASRRRRWSRSSKEKESEGHQVSTARQPTQDVLDTRGAEENGYGDQHAEDQGSNNRSSKKGRRPKKLGASKTKRPVPIIMGMVQDGITGLRKVAKRPFTRPEKGHGEASRNTPQTSPDSQERQS